MRCPKCQYITFDSADRCRNCGYDFSLSADLPPMDLPIKDEAPDGPLADFSLSETDLRSTPVPGAPPVAPSGNTSELPLFRDRVRPAREDVHAPLVTPSVVPRPPLAVRRNTGPLAKPRPRRDPAPELPRLALDTAEMPIVTAPVIAAAPETAPLGEPAAITATAGPRLVAGLIDLAITLAVDVTVLYLTLRVCELRFPDVLSLPLGPLAVFYALINGGYFAAFVAAGGQTIGKMATGIRVIPGDPGAAAGDRVSPGQAAIRAAGYLVSALPLGLGFLPGFMGEERRAFHDRLADTRVVDA